MPGIRPLLARSRKQTRQIPKWRRTWIEELIYLILATCGLPLTWKSTSCCQSVSNKDHLYD
jgi:hypothetical protein